MPGRRCFRLYASCLCLGLPLLLAACAGADKPPVRFAPAPASSFTISARAGDSVPALARRYGVKEDDVLALNDIRDANRLVVGEAIRIPAYGRLQDKEQQSLASRSVPQGAPAPQRPPAPRQASLPQGALAPQQASLPPRAAPTTRVEVNPQVAALSSPKQKPAQQSSGIDMDWLFSFSSEMPDPKIGAVKFLWPVEGRVIANFGPRATGERNDGIDISTTRGAPIHAAADGTVSYVGNDLKTYGNLILIRHDNGFVTAYAHADSVAVMRGQRVTAGQVIAYVGATGDVAEPELHFELRAGTRAINPQPYFAGPN